MKLTLVKYPRIGSIHGLEWDVMNRGVTMGWTIGTEVFRLDSTLTRKAYQLTKDVELLDSPEAQIIRDRFPENSHGPTKAVCNDR